MYTRALLLPPRDSRSVPARARRRDVIIRIIFIAFILKSPRPGARRARAI